MPEFVVQSGKYRGKRLKIVEPEIVFGRDESCRVRITSPDVSRYHCLIRQTETGWTVRDLGSSNGTWVNDAQLAGDRALQAGDLIRVGPMVLEFCGTGPFAHKKGGTKRSKPTSEEDIVNWLAEESATSSTGDTTIISTKHLAAAQADTDHGSGESGSPASPAAKEPDKPQMTLAEEAADIIRRHWESLELEQAAEGNESA